MIGNPEEYKNGRITRILKKKKHKERQNRELNLSKSDFGTLKKSQEIQKGADGKIRKRSVKTQKEKKPFVPKLDLNKIQIKEFRVTQPKLIKQKPSSTGELGKLHSQTLLSNEIKSPDNPRDATDSRQKSSLEGKSSEELSKRVNKFNSEQTKTTIQQRLRVTNQDINLTLEEDLYITENRSLSQYEDRLSHPGNLKEIFLTDPREVKEGRELGKNSKQSPTTSVH